jgi:hypothetical protein
VLRVLAGTLFGGKGRFETLLIMTGYALWAPWYPLIVVDSIHATPKWLYNTVLGGCILLLLVQVSMAARAEERIGWPAAAACAAAAAGSVGVVLFTYIR